MPVAALVGWGGATLGTLTTAAQVARVRRRGTDGVNATTWSLFALMSCFWLAYGVAVRSSEIVVASLAGAPLLCWLLALLETAPRWQGLRRAALGVGVLAVAPTLLLGWDAGLLGIGVLVVATRAPQLVQLVTSRHAHGVSTSSWALGSLSVGLWLTYYVVTGRSFAATSMLMALATNVAIVALAMRRHRGGAAAAPTWEAPAPALAVPAHVVPAPVVPAPVVAGAAS